MHNEADRKGTMMQEQQQQKVTHLQDTKECILVVDDDLNLCQTIQLVLEEEGFTVETAMDGVEALEQVEQLHPTMIVLDMGLPLLDGEAVAKELQVRYEQPIPVVLITADGHITEKRQRVGAIAALGKPFEIDDLVSAVHLALSSRDGSSTGL
jgi:two-component system response regulator VicR